MIEPLPSVSALSCLISYLINQCFEEYNTTALAIAPLIESHLLEMLPPLSHFPNEKKSHMSESN